MRFAAIADIHGNSAALEAVLEDMDSLKVSMAVNLGDFFSGPLDAAAAASLLIKANFPSIRGNHDRYLIEQERSEMGPSDQVAFDQLSKMDLDWIAGLPSTLEVFDGVFMCHGTPKSDSNYWLERVEENGIVRSATLHEIEREAEGVNANLILCAHTHIPRCVRLPDGRTIVNPGSVGCPAYNDSIPFYHYMQTGSPNASYAIIELNNADCSVTFRSVPYRTNEASELATQNGQKDWARALATGWFEG